MIVALCLDFPALKPFALRHSVAASHLNLSQFRNTSLISSSKNIAITKAETRISKSLVVVVVVVAEMRK